MEPAPDLAQIIQRLKEVELDPWGPDGVRYVAMLFWNHQGYRALLNTLHRESWPRWNKTSGPYWDLFWAGCYRYQPSDFYGDNAMPLIDDEPPVYWSEQKSGELISDIESRQNRWRFAGPIELVVVGARRTGGEFEFEWESLRSLRLPADRLGTAIADYTESHIASDPDVLGELPTPGSFTDDLPPSAVLTAMAKLGPNLLRWLGVGR